MKKAKKILALLLCAVLLIGASVMGTLAYLTSQDEVVNNFTVGKVQIILDEAPVDANGDEIDGDRVKTNSYKLLPGHEYDKDPQVHVVAGSEDCYVRLYVTITKSGEWDAICSKYKVGAADMFVGLDSDWTLKHSTPNLAGANTRTYEFWYSTKVTDIPEDANKDLDPLFTGIKMPKQLTNEDLATLGEDFKIFVVAQAIQADGFANVDAAFGTDGAPAISGDALKPTA